MPVCHRPILSRSISKDGRLEALARSAARLSPTHRPEPISGPEMHGETMREKQRKVAEIVDSLCDAGYKKIVHVETGTSITPANSVIAVEGHLYCPH